MAANMSSVVGFFLSYVMGLVFVTNGLALLDIPHNLSKGLKWLFRINRKEPVKDTWYFDIGYYQAYSLTIFLLCLIFSTIVPIINVFAFMFFGLQFLTYKYYFIFVYIQDFEARGRLRNSIIPL